MLWMEQKQKLQISRLYDPLLAFTLADTLPILSVMKLWLEKWPDEEVSEKNEQTH